MKRFLILLLLFLTGCSSYADPVALKADCVALSPTVNKGLKASDEFYDAFHNGKLKTIMAKQSLLTIQTTVTDLRAIKLKDKLYQREFDETIAFFKFVEADIKKWLDRKGTMISEDTERVYQSSGLSRLMFYCDGLVNNTNVQN